jgi:DNA-binding beta-propeller fold protein YncE
VPPRAVIGGPFGGLVHPTGVALDPSHGEIFVTDSIRNGLFTFLAPEFFR